MWGRYGSYPGILDNQEPAQFFGRHVKTLPQRLNALRQLRLRLPTHRLLCNPVRNGDDVRTPIGQEAHPIDDLARAGADLHVELNPGSLRFAAGCAAAHGRVGENPGLGAAFEAHGDARENPGLGGAFEAHDNTRENPGMSWVLEMPPRQIIVIHRTVPGAHWAATPGASVPGGPWAATPAASVPGGPGAAPPRAAVFRGASSGAAGAALPCPAIRRSRLTACATAVTAVSTSASVEKRPRLNLRLLSARRSSRPKARRT